MKEKNNYITENTKTCIPNPMPNYHFEYESGKQWSTDFLVGIFEASIIRWILPLGSNMTDPF